MKYILIVLFIFGCSTQKSSQEIDTVSLHTPENTDISIDTTITDSESEDLVISDSKIIEDKMSYEVTLIHYSTLYSSLAIFYYFKELEEQNIKLNRIVSNGFAFLIATLYAKEKNLSTVEWKLFGLLKNLASEKIYTKDWIEIIEEFAQEEFGNSKLSSLKIPVSYPLLIDEEVQWNRNISVKKAILDNINLLSGHNYLIKPQIFDHKIRSLSRLGHIHSIAFLDKKISLNLQDGFVWGLMTNYLSFVNNHPNIQFITSADPKPLDVLNPMTKLESMYRENISENVKHLIEELEKTNELNSASSF